MKTNTIAKWSVTTLLAVAPVFAQQSIANIPFDFTVGKTKMAAGTYLVRCDHQAYVLLQRDDRKASVMVPTIGRMAPLGSDVGSRLIFNRYGDAYFLSEAWQAGVDTGRQLLRSKLEREVAGEFAQRGESARLAVVTGSTAASH